MTLSTLISKECILLNQSFRDKQDFVTQATDLLVNMNICTNKDQFITDVSNRESLSSTDLEEGVAIPHAKSKAITTPTIIATTLKTPWKNSEGNTPISIAFLLAIPESSNSEHIEILSSLSTLLLEKSFINKLISASSTEEFINILSNNSKHLSQTASSSYDIVAVTACPVGVAHTYIAAKKLQVEAENMGITIKVETQGSIGVENALDKEDIANAKAVILACDKTIDKARFNGKNVVECGVKEAINKPNTILKQAIEQKGKILNSSNDSTQQKEEKTPFYRYLMGGVSAIIPLVVVGGVYIALAIALSGVEAGKGVNITNPFLKNIEQIGGLAFGLLIPILGGFIAMSIADKPGFVPGLVGGALAGSLGTGFLGGIFAGFVGGFFASKLAKIKLPESISAILPIFIIPLIGTGLTVLTVSIVGSPIKNFIDVLTSFLQSLQGGSALLLGAIIGAMIAFDMGGPVNKVAFLFGVSMIQSGIPEIMGMVAVAVCTPPLGIWLATRIKPSYFDQQEREAGTAALFMGLIGITEGAIPFAVANPLKVIPALMLGSMSGSMLAAIWKVGDHAPHGGPIVLPVVNNPIGFIIAICIGMLITALSLIFFLSLNSKKSK